MSHRSHYSLELLDAEATINFLSFARIDWKLSTRFRYYLRLKIWWPPFIPTKDFNLIMSCDPRGSHFQKNKRWLPHWDRNRWIYPSECVISKYRSVIGWQISAHKILDWSAQQLINSFQCKWKLETWVASLIPENDNNLRWQRQLGLAL